MATSPSREQALPQHSGVSENSYEPQTYDSQPSLRHHEPTKKIFGACNGSPTPTRRSASGRRTSGHLPLSDTSLTAQIHNHPEAKGMESVTPRIGSLPRPVGGSDKLGTFSGVFVPTTLNVLSILMFLRFGFILGQSGVIAMMGMLIASYLINLITTLSLSAIATNGTVRGGGAYYLISRSLGPEFGGSIGVVFYLSFVFNTGMNAVGLVDCVKHNFGDFSGDWARWLPEGFWLEYLWATVILVICTAICLAGSGLFARCSNGLLLILLVATFSIPFSALVLEPFRIRGLGIEYTGISAKTFMGNLRPNFTRHADGSQLHGRENIQHLFGILFPATGGIFAGASMSGDLKHPSKAIPKGTLSGLGLTFMAYTLVILAMAATITRESFYNDANIVQNTNISGVLILLGEFATTFFSSLMGVIGSAKLLQALARDSLLPGFSIFGQGTKSHDEPTYAIVVTHFIGQLTMLCDVNQIATLITMSYLMCFVTMNVACFLLAISSAPNFRPSFRYFNWWTAGFGALVSGATMFFVDGVYAITCISLLVSIFLIVHYTSPPKSWGDVSQSLIYHQVRKYLLRLRQEHVKFWRPQILLFVNDPRHQYELTQFCNSLKKGGLFILAHVIVASDFGSAVPEARRQQAAWKKYIDLSKVKAFVNIAISPAVEWGTRNLVLSAGLGGMRPNIVVMGAYNMHEFRAAQPLVDVPSMPASEMEQGNTYNPQVIQENGRRVEKQQGLLPTDNCRTEGAVGIQSYVAILEDLLLQLQINVAVAKGFKDLKFPRPTEGNTRKYIDLWPIQMSAEIAMCGREDKQNILTTNFDTYTLILQLGCILNTVPAWKKVYRLRVAVFVEYESDVEEERGRVKTLLDNLRIQAEILVFWLASGEIKSYQLIVNGDSAAVGRDAERTVHDVLKDEEWWQDVLKLRGRREDMSAVEELAEARELLSATPNWPSSSFQHGRRGSPAERFEGLKRLIRKSKRRRSISGFGELGGVRPAMRTHRLHDDLVHRHASHASASEDSESEDSEILENGHSDRASTLSKASAATENDMDDYEGEFEEQGNGETTVSNFPSRITRRRSQGDSIRGPKPPTRPSPKESRLKALTATDEKKPPTLSETASTTPQAPPKQDLPSISNPDKPSEASLTARPRIMRHSTAAARFSSNPVPRTTVASEDGPGPSIMFTESSSPSHVGRHPSIYKHPNNPSSSSPTPSNAATGFPFPQSVPLSFNDLPCRAQHLILNELMQKQSKDTAVLFTTLPSPVEGTCKNEEECVGYLSDLEVLCENLPPILLVHSNSMTVTCSL